MFWSEGPMMDARPAGTYYRQPPARQPRPSRRFGGVNPHTGAYRDREEEMLRRQLHQQEIIRQRDVVRRRRHHEQELLAEQAVAHEEQRRRTIAARRYEIARERRLAYITWNSAARKIQRWWRAVLPAHRAAVAERDVKRRSAAAVTIVAALARNVAKIRARHVTDSLKRLWELQGKIDAVPGLTAEELASDSSNKAAKQARLLFGHTLEKLVLSADDIPIHSSLTARAIRKRIVLSANARLQLLDDATAAVDAAEAMAEFASSGVPSDDGLPSRDGASEADETEGTVEMTDTDDDMITASESESESECDDADDDDEVAAATTFDEAIAAVDAARHHDSSLHVRPGRAPATGPNEVGGHTEFFDAALATGDDADADADTDAASAAEDDTAMEQDEDEDEHGSDSSFEHISASAAASAADSESEGELALDQIWLGLGSEAAVEAERDLAMQAIKQAEDVGGAAALQAAADAAARSHLADVIESFSHELANLQSELQESTDLDLTNTVTELQAAVNLISRD